jgi:carboxylesterase type B
VASSASPRTLADQEQLGVKFAESKNARSIANLRAMAWKDLSGTTLRFGVVVDGYVLPSSVADAFASGKQNDVPTLTGANKHEGGATPHPDITADAFQKQARQRYGEMADEFLALYPSSTDEEARASQNESSWDQTRTSMYLWAKNRAKTARTKAFTYFWDHPLPGPDVEKYGAFHTSEVPYVMNALSMSQRPFTEEDRRIADTLSSYWANFIKTGDPNGPGLPRWPGVASDPAMTMEIGETNAPVSVAGSTAKLAFFERFFARQRQSGTR